MRNLRLFDVDPARIDKGVSLAKIPPVGFVRALGCLRRSDRRWDSFQHRYEGRHNVREKRSIVLGLVFDALGNVSKLGGPRCCKASAVLALEAAKKSLRRRYEVRFDDAMPMCEFTGRNLEDCVGKSCLVHRESKDERVSNDLSNHQI